MQFRTATPAQARRGRDPLILFVFQGAREPAGRHAAIDRRLRDRLADAVRRERFKGGKSTVAVVIGEKDRPIVFAGLGKRSEFTDERLRAAAGRATGRVKRRGATLQLVLPGVGNRAAEAHAATVGAGLALYAFDRYKPKKDPATVKTVSVVTDAPAQAARGMRRAATYVEATALVRDLVNEPAMVMTPRRMADEARAVARRSKGRIKVKVFNTKQILKRKMVGLHGVSIGSSQPPRFVHMTYRAARPRRTVALVGKGITFDSGGLDLKTAAGMSTMKCDMAGAGTVIGVMSALSRIRPNVTVHGIFAATENMTGPHAYKPGDVLTYANGKTVEITNTDAEGRLVLGDALIYACKLKPDVVIDIATLTGACVVALGPTIAGLFTEDDRLADRLTASGEAEGEKLWRMPIEDSYFELIKSKVAHMVNAGSRYGGAINAALFLREFVDNGATWAHLDIAGPAFGESGGPYHTPGGTGFPVRALLNYLEG